MQLFYEFRTNKLKLCAVATALLTLAIYLIYIFLSENSSYAINSKRKYELESRCASASELIVKNATNVEGIFFNPDLDLRTTQIKNQAVAMFPSNSTAKYFLENGYLMFYETADKLDDSGYFKYSIKSKTIKSASLDSQYSVSTTFNKAPPFLNIFSATVRIIDLRDNSLAATSTFVVDEQTGKVCGKVRSEFPVVSFVQEALGLTQKYPMQAPEKGNKPVITWK